MIADRDSAHVESTMTGKKVAMGFDENSLEHLMSVMTDLYSDPEMAIIREYSTNALDSHIEAGVTRPIEVTLPTSLQSFLRIKDYGIGMDAQTIEDTYSKYGASTKRSTNDQVGMLGLGCKSALTYTNQFSVIGIKNGSKVTVSVSRDETGSNMTIDGPFPTDEPNGVEVVIPAKRGHTLAKKAEDFFKFWQPGTVLVDGKEPARISGLQVTDKLLVRDNQNADYYSRDAKNYVVMGNVAYPVDAAELETGLSYGYSLVATVDIGTVNIPPNRESLMYTAKTQATLKQIQSDLSAAIVQAIQAEVDKAPDKMAAIEALTSWRNVLPSSAQPKAGAYTYKGATIPAEIAAGDKEEGYMATSTTSHVLSRTSTVRAIPVGQWPDILWVTNYSPGKYTASHKKKMNKYRVDGGLEDLGKCVMLRGAIPPEVKKWMPKEHIVDWSVIKEVKLPRQLSGQPSNGISQRLAGSYDFWRKDQWHTAIAADEIDTNAPLYFHHGNRWESFYYAEVLMRLKPNCTVVALSANRLDKFQRDFPMAQKAYDAAHAEVDAWCEKYLKAGKNRIWFGLEDEDIRDEFSALDPGRLDDPILSKIVRIAKTDLTNLKEQRSLLQSVKYNAGNIHLNGWKNPLDKYPLYEAHLLNTAEDHTYLYLNAAYAAENGKAGA